jgi:hypothetical protein
MLNKNERLTLCKMKIAFLFFGQPRVLTQHNYNLLSLRNCQESNPNCVFDTYIHQWISPIGEYCYSRWSSDCAVEPEPDIEEYILTKYKPRAQVFESPLEVSNVLSQIHSVQKVCSLVENPEQYHLFILLRFDCEIDLPPLADLDNTKLYKFSDIVQVFGQKALEVYKMLPDPGVEGNAETHRSIPLSKANIEVVDLPSGNYLFRTLREANITLEKVVNSGFAWITTTAAYCRHLGDDKYLCKFPNRGCFTIVFRQKSYIIENESEVIITCSELISREEKTEPPPQESAMHCDE